MKINMLDHEFDVGATNGFEWANTNLGKSSVHKLQILVKKDLPVDLQNSTLIHELVHMIADLSNVELDEQDVDGLALGFHSLLKNNKHFISGIWDDMGRLIE